MKRKIRKIFLAWEFEKEEKWLNEMSAKGLQLCDVGFCKYIFEEGPPGEYTYRLEMLPHLPSHSESIKYINFIEDTGAEQIATLFRWVYFRKKTDENDFALFSDIASHLKHLDRVLLLMGILAAINLCSAAYQLRFFSQGISVNMLVFLLCLSVGGVLGYGFLRALFARQRMKKEKFLHE